MTQAYPPPPRGSNADQDTATLPKVGTQQPQSPQSGGWSSPGVNSGSAAGAGSGPGSDDGSGSGLGSKLASKASAAKGAMKASAAEAETRAGRSRSARGSRQPRRARLTLSHINVYSVFKFSCVLAIALFFVWLIMVGVLYGILDVSGVFSKVNETVQTITGDEKTGDVVTGSLVFGGAIIIGAVNIVLFIALSTIGAMIYNLCADLVGGTEVTLSERE
ncbi:MAG: DUF3566 domain-containing protein [Jatrophihabitantaceae bacterium]